MIRFFIFAYVGDAEIAVECVRCARMAIPEGMVTVVDDAAHPVPMRTVEELRMLGANYVKSTWDRRGNLRGPECIRGILEVMSQGVGEDDIVVKVDCDTVLLDGAWLRWMEKRSWVQLYASGAWVDGGWRIYGCLYAMRGWVALRLLREINWDAMDALAPEDWTIGAAALGILPVGLAQVVEPWSQRTPWSEWTAWNWYSLTTSAERYAKRFSVVTVGNAELYGKPASARARVMRQLIDAKERLRLPI